MSAVPTVTFDLEYLESMRAVREQVQDCEGKHLQQVAYSTFHDALTQICFGCRKVRTSMMSGRE